MLITKRNLPAVGLIVTALALPAGAAPPCTAPPPSDPGGFCLTPRVLPVLGGPGRSASRDKRFELRGPSYDLRCGGAAWIDGGRQAYLEDDLVLITPQERTTIFCNQALYDKAGGTILLQGNVRVTVSRAGSPTPVVRTGDRGLVSLGSAAAPPQIDVQTDPPEESDQSVRRAAPVARPPSPEAKP